MTEASRSADCRRPAASEVCGEGKEEVPPVDTFEPCEIRRLGAALTIVGDGERLTSRTSRFCVAIERVASAGKPCPFIVMSVVTVAFATCDCALRRACVASRCDSKTDVGRTRGRVEMEASLFVDDPGLVEGDVYEGLGERVDCLVRTWRAKLLVAVEGIGDAVPCALDNGERIDAM